MVKHGARRPLIRKPDRVSPKFNVTLVDPASYKYAHLLTDLCRTIAYGLRDLGLTCDLTVNSIEPGCTNIIVGTHLLTAEDVANIVDSGAAYIPLQSEWLYLDSQTDTVSSSFQGQQFQTIAGPLLERAVTVWDGLTELPLLRRLGVADDRVKRFKMGYCAGLEDIEQRPYARKDVDVLFFGSRTPHRSEIFASLQGMRVEVFEYGPSAFRNEMIARAKINLSLHSGPGLSYFPQTRTAYLLNNRGFVVAEPSVDHPPMRALVAETAPEALPDLCSRLLTRPSELESRAESAYEAYRLMPMSEIVSGLL